MQALNLMIADENPIFFIIGMDREKVAAGLALSDAPIKCGKIIANFTIGCQIPRAKF
jgi:hypothetical protein